MTVKKTLKKKASVKKTASKAANKATKKQAGMAENIMGSANEIWLAGLGAFAKAQEEGVKIFNKLVDEGKDFENVFKKVPQSAVKEVKTTVDKVKGKATQSWDKLENIFESRVERTLKKLDIPTNIEISALLNKIEALASEVSKLTGDYVSDVKDATVKAVETPAKKAAAKKAPVKKAAVKKAPVKKAAVKKTPVKKAAVKKAPVKKAVTKKVTKK
jgi:poly(hydroxyalkanoate) granule-associated protein